MDTAVIADLVTATRLDPVPHGFVLEFEERWEPGGQISEITAAAASHAVQ